MLSDVVVETFLPEYSFGAMFEHQLRWARTVRDLRKCGYLGVLLTFGLPWAMAAALCAGGAGWSLGLLGAVAVARFASGYVLCGPILNDRQTLRDLWLIPARDVVGVAIWFASFGGDTIVWRGETIPSEGWAADKSVILRRRRWTSNPTFANRWRMWATVIQLGKLKFSEAEHTSGAEVALATKPVGEPVVEQIDGHTRSNFDKAVGDR